ncbi:MAG TPA: pilus assembly protein N-terminal domain-containing protein [Patescibacteria group bacterium]|nr:pilus assembly protein N-terminal domain-containing protein [Patescibacteria group bacterium]
MKKALRTFMALSAAMLLCMPAARAADTPADMTDDAANAPEYDMQGEETHPPIRLTPDKPQIVNLDTDASSVIVGNPAHLNAIMDTTRSLVLVPRDPGATHLTVMGQNGKPIMERYVIVGAPAQKYIRIRRDCTGVPGSSCEPESVYYCPDMCHETGILASKMGQMNTMPAPRPIPQNTSENKEGATPANTTPNAGEAAPQNAPADNGTHKSPPKEQYFPLYPEQ